MPKTVTTVETPEVETPEVETPEVETPEVAPVQPVSYGIGDLVDEDAQPEEVESFPNPANAYAEALLKGDLHVRQT